MFARLEKSKLPKYVTYVQIEIAVLHLKMPILGNYP
jgi:hypothetical protein